MPGSRALTGLRVLVTGASSGIGAAVSELLAQRGCRVAGAGRCPGSLLVGPVGPLEAAVVADLTRPGAPEQVVSEAAATLGGIDVVISNAGAGWSGPYESMPPSEIDGIIDINLRAPMHLAQAAAPYLRHSAAGGQLILVGSIAGLVGVADEVAYATAKAGLRGLADSLRAEWSSTAASAAVRYSAAASAGPGGNGKATTEVSGNGRGGDHSGDGRPEGHGRGTATGRVTVTLVSLGPVDTPFYSRRNRPYMRSWPKPVPVNHVATSIAGAIEHRWVEVVVPAWLGLPARLNGGSPALYRALAAMQARFAL